ncbi:MAG: NUDIX domain-containing protein [Nanoarchaeota archaeon]
MSEDSISVSFLPVYTAGKDVNYYLQGREVDKSHHPRTDLFQPGNYPFYWPGNVAIFGGHLEPGENPVQALKREMKEEIKEIESLDQHIHSQELRSYRWKDESERILGIIDEANELFQGNVYNFLGFSLNDIVYSSALNRGDRKRYGVELPTYKEWIFGREIDHYLIMDVDEQLKLTDKEGLGGIWLPHWVARSICMVPIDKIALLDDMNKRIKKGTLEIKISQK